MIGGTIIGKSNLEDYVEPFVYSNKMIEMDQESLTIKDQHNARIKVLEIIKKYAWLYVLIGVGIGAVIHNWIPEDIISAVLGEDKWHSVLIATLVRIYVLLDIFGTLPEALVSKGAGLGTVLAFMVAQLPHCRYHR